MNNYQKIKTQAGRRAWIRERQQKAEIRNIKRRLKTGNERAGDRTRLAELEART